MRINRRKADGEAMKRLTRGVRAATLEGERLYKLELSQPGSGVVYRRGKRTHQASAPGEPPAPDTGRLRNGASSDVSRLGLTRVEGMITNNVEYAAALEIGTETIAERPALTTLLGKHLARIKQAFQIGARKG